MNSAFENYIRGPLSDALDISPPSEDLLPPDKPVSDSRPQNKLSFPDEARFLVMVYINEQRKLQGKVRKRFSDHDVYLVWFSKTILNWKAMVSTTEPDGMYYEVTHNGEKEETYLDAYQKIDNVVYPD